MSKENSKFPARIAMRSVAGRQIPNSKFLTILLMGRSGCGKGTQAELLKNVLEERAGKGSALYVYTGEELRKMAQQKETQTGQLLELKVMEAGIKAPDFLAIAAWGSVLINKLTPGLHLILDGSPRTVLEARILDEAFEFYDRKNVLPILLDVSRKESFSRLKARGRFDDTDETINNRLDYYEKYVVPAIEYYKNKSKNKLIVIDANPRDIQKIHQDIIKAISLV